MLRFGKEGLQEDRWSNKALTEIRRRNLSPSHPLGCGTTAEMLLSWYEVD